MFARFEQFSTLLSHYSPNSLLSRPKSKYLSSRQLYKLGENNGHATLGVSKSLFDLPIYASYNDSDENKSTTKMSNDHECLNIMGTEKITPCTCLLLLAQ